MVSRSACVFQRMSENPIIVGILQMSVNLTSSPATSAPPLCLKRAGLDDPEQEVQKHKRPRLAPPPFPGLAPCLRPRSHSPAPPCADSQCVSSIGPYILLEPCEGAETFRAIHRVTEQQYTCKVHSCLNTCLSLHLSVSSPGSLSLCLPVFFSDCLSCELLHINKQPFITGLVARLLHLSCYHHNIPRSWHYCQVTAG